MPEQEQKQEELVGVWKEIESLEVFLKRWSAFSLPVTDSPGPLYTAGVHAILEVVRAEATTLQASVEAIKEEIETAVDEIDTLKDMLAEACWRC